MCRCSGAELLCRHLHRGVPGQVGEECPLYSENRIVSLSSTGKHFSHSFGKYRQSTYCAPGSLPRAGGMAANEGDRSPCPSGAFSLVRETRKARRGLRGPPPTPTWLGSLDSQTWHMPCLWREHFSLHLLSNSSHLRCQLTLLLAGIAQSVLFYLGDCRRPSPGSP